MQARHALRVARALVAVGRIETVTVRAGVPSHGVKLEVITYAVVKRFGEIYFRSLLTSPAKLEEASGHAGLACEGLVVFAAEVELGPAGRLIA